MAKGVNISHHRKTFKVYTQEICGRAKNLHSSPFLETHSLGLKRGTFAGQ